ncbi:Major facilitator superfamily domain, general substrate transporter [Penicillium expansum]|uniref:Major facilitator superfamily domain, general substrate transporter n=1 Tax=Penicillium expansum TaxID=27334 RepID=A0A0A2JU20_PENEN|nr:Major facilitator superfamily domain, general substrate transporter [Penicillium expansum]KGO58336.1 Major facilitator superfamily domain, general substrate transporter [Penicillium expansum]
MASQVNDSGVESPSPSLTATGKQAGDTVPINITVDETSCRPTDKDLKELVHVADNVPYPVWLAILVGSAERFVFYGASTCLQNYLQNSPNDLIPGVLGIGQSNATAVNYAFMVLVNFAPVPLAVVADGWLGRYKLILLSTVIYLVGFLILFTTALPSALHHAGVSAAGLGVSLVLIAVGIGGVNASVYPFIADQYPHHELFIRELPSGERVVVDRSLTIQYMYNWYFWFINVASLSGIATTFMERYSSFWSAFLLCFCFLWVGLVLMLVFKNKYYKAPPAGSVVPKVLRVIWLGIRGGMSLNAAQPAVQQEKYGRQVPWDDEFLKGVRDALIACQICLAFPIVWLCWGQTYNNLISQAGQMETYGIPNDVMPNFNPIACIIVGPLIQQCLFPFLNRRKIPFRPIARISVGFFFMGASLAWATGLQAFIYRAGPCLDYPLACPDSKNGTIPQHINVFLQVPCYVFMAIGEIFCVTTGSEFCYSRAPRSMKSIVQALFVGTASISYALGIAISSAAKDPHMTIFYGSLTGVQLAITAGFWLMFRKLDRDIIV